jgi:hypothetical protein
MFFGKALADLSEVLRCSFDITSAISPISSSNPSLGEVDEAFGERR